MSDKKSKQYQYQIDDQDDNQKQEIEMQQPSQNEQGQEIFQEKSNSTHSTPSSKKKKGAARLKAKKSVSSLSQIERKDSTTEVNPQHKSSLQNSYDQNKNAKLPVLQDFQFITIKKDVNYSSFEKTIANYTKGQELQMNEQSFYKVKKNPKHKRGFFEYFTSNAQRYIFIEKGMFYTLRKIKDEKFVVQSARELGTLFKIYEDKQNCQKLILCFLNKERNPKIAPNIKEFYFASTAKLQEFLQAIEKTLQLQGFQVIK
ncbi:hypothetical protein ABPG72_013088 [Tetrahymena utriculariae]